MWTWKQSTGEIFRDGNLVAQGYSGFGAGRNNTAMQDVPDVGPIPRGAYLFLFPRNTTTHGPYVLPLKADPANEMYGRSGFLCHGDSADHPGQASHGCVILPRPVRESIWASGDTALTVIA
jgi:hypothetical protein